MTENAYNLPDNTPVATEGNTAPVAPAKAAKAPKAAPQPDPVEVAAEKGTDLRPRQIWSTEQADNPFEKPVQVLIADTRRNVKDVLWAKFSRYLPNTTAQPFEYLTEKDFRAAYPKFVELT